jgi:hypothetical protein
MRDIGCSNGLLASPTRNLAGGLRRIGTFVGRQRSADERRRGKLEASMLRDHIAFLQTAIVFLLLTNAVSALVAAYAMKTANLLVRPAQQKSAVERRLEAFVRKTA